MFIDFHSHLTSGLRSQSGEIKFNKKKYIYIMEYWFFSPLCFYSICAGIRSYFNGIKRIFNSINIMLQRSWKTPYKKKYE